MRAISFALVLTLAACAEPYQPETLAILAQNPTATNRAKIDEIDVAVRTVKALDAAGVSSGYWECIGGYVVPILNDALASGATVFDRPSLSELVYEGQKICTGIFPAFDAELVETAAEYRLTHHTDNPALDELVNELWLNQLEPLLHSVLRRNTPEHPSLIAVGSLRGPTQPASSSAH
jgi:hypothetical protein